MFGLTRRHRLRFYPRPRWLQALAVDACILAAMPLEPVSDPSRVPSSCLFEDPRWATALAEYYGFDLRGLTLGDRPGEVPYVLLDGFGSPRVVTLPFSDYLPLDDRRTVEECAARLRERHPDASVTLRTRLPSGESPAGGELTRGAVLHVIPAGGAGPNAKFRANARRAERDGVTVRRCSSPAALDRFYRLFAALRVEKFASIPQPLGFFRAVFDAFAADDAAFFLEALYEGEVIASFFIVESGGRAYYKYSASSLDTLVPRPNNLLFRWLHDALAEGAYEAIDLGLSGSGEAYEGLRYFKRTAGGVETPISYFTWRPEGYDGSASVAFKAEIGRIVDQVVGAGLSPQQLDRISRAIYVHFA